MTKPFRKYMITIDWREEDEFFTSKICINLYDVKEWMPCINSKYEFKDGIKRTVICGTDGTNVKARVEFEVFDKIMDNFLRDTGNLDERSLTDQKSQGRRIPLAMTYKGPMGYLFHDLKDKIVCNAYPVGTVITNFEDGVHKVLYSNIIPMN